MSIRQARNGLRMATVAIILSFVVACHRAASSQQPATGAGGTLTADTLRGIVAVVGSEPLTSVTVTVGNGANPVVVRGEAVADLRAVTGIEVTLFGSATGASNDAAMPRDTPVFTASRFVVRSVQGAVAHDGKLVRTESGFALQRADGSLGALTSVPLTLQAQVGARIFWVGPLDRAPDAYGVIKSAPLR